jgi:hypothetical protein
VQSDDEIRFDASAIDVYREHPGEHLRANCLFRSA